MVHQNNKQTTNQDLSQMCPKCGVNWFERDCHPACQYGKMNTSMVEGDNEADDDELDTSTSFDRDVRANTIRNSQMIDETVEAPRRNPRKTVKMAERVVCENCGVRGHLAEKCSEHTQNVRCRNCKLIGHYQLNCPLSPVMRCFRCNSDKHRAADCITNPRQKNKNGVDFADRVKGIDEGGVKFNRAVNGREGRQKAWAES